MSERAILMPPNRRPGRLVGVNRHCAEAMHYGQLLAWPSFCPLTGPSGHVFVLFSSLTPIGLVLADIRYASRDYSLMLVNDMIGWVSSDMVVDVSLFTEKEEG